MKHAESLMRIHLRLLVSVTMQILEAKCNIAASSSEHSRRSVRAFVGRAPLPREGIMSGSGQAILLAMHGTTAS